MKSNHVPTVVTIAGALAILCGQALPADKYSVKAPGGLAFSEFKGYETWEVVSVSHPAGGEGMSGEVINVIVANPVMIKAYAAGIPGNGKPFPDGAKVAKVQYVPKKSTEAPFDTAIPDRQKGVAFMAKDAKRFPDSGGWGYGLFNYDSVSDEFTPEGTGATCGVACHSIVKAKDYVFTRYETR